jgi:hypothetical protein
LSDWQERSGCCLANDMVLAGGMENMTQAPL